MARYVIKSKKVEIHKKDFKVPMINIVPAVIWSIPIYQFLFPVIGKALSLLVCITFVLLYVYLSVKAVIAAIPCLASVVMYVALFWSLTGGIDSEIFRVIMKVLILLAAIFIELAIFSNATLPWLQYKE